MVSQRLKKQANELVYLQKARPCIRNHFITKADRSLVDCLCECADNMLRGNVPLTKLQKGKLKRNKAVLRVLTKKSVSLKKKKTILQKGRRRTSQAIRPIVHSIFKRLRRLQTQTRGSRTGNREIGPVRRQNFGKRTKNNEGQGKTLVEKNEEQSRH
jgi:hypothetical protein